MLLGKVMSVKVEEMRNKSAKVVRKYHVGEERSETDEILDVTV